ncbi:MAG TPA: 7TM-DISM domain-containing protein [Spirochaetota bacterium]|nr:7TM-DISM domain-containing protein [Spirochaetota bacterium]HQF07458.1 7TM-DISM domain-containing protein [Spirochaetota bacterium]HQH96718.1 7TM-DISM domain-containing protein [Spirochaetota bacterium]
MGVIRTFIAAAGILTLVSSVQSAPIRLNESLDQIPIGLHIEFLKDVGGALSIDDVSSPAFAGTWFPSGETYPGFGFTGAVYWARFTLVNTTGKEIPFYLEQAYPLIHDLQLYVPNGHNAFRKIETGTRFNFSNRPCIHRTFVFPLSIEANSSKTYYIRQKTPSSMYFPLTIWSPSHFTASSVIEDRLLMFYYGMMIIMAFNYLFIYFLIRHLSYLNFTLFILSILLFIMSQIGVTFQLLMPNSPDLAGICPPLFLCLANLTSNRFILVFLQLKKNAPVFKKALDGQAIIQLLATCSAITIPFFDTYKLVMPVTAFMTVVSIITAFCAGIYLVWRRQRSAYIFAPISMGFLAGSILYVLRSFGLIAGSFLTTWSIVIGSATFLVTMSIAMVDRINVMRKGLKLVSQKLEEEIKERSIELLLSEIVSKITEDRGKKAPAAGGISAYAPSIRTILDNQRDLAITKLSRDISIISNMDELREKTIRKAKELTQARKVYFFTIDEYNDMELRTFIDDLEGKRNGYCADIVEEVLDNGAPVITSSGSGQESPSVMCIPIKSADRTIGICYFEKAAADFGFTEKDSLLLMAFADNIVGVFENALQYRRKMSREDAARTYSITSVTKEKINKAIEYINANYTCDISREGLAASLDISPNHLGKFFKVQTGKKINEYINELRIRDAAKKLREQKQETIINIAFSVGFESLSTFNRTFLKIMGITPSEYKDRQ